MVDRWAQSGALSPPEGIRPSEALYPDSPQQADGIRSDPPPSDPVASGTMPAAMAAADPPDEPPGVCSRFHGLRVGPNSGLSVSAFQPSSGVFVLPITTHPAATSRDTRIESSVAGARPASAAEPWVVTYPAASSRSFTPSGMPARGPGSRPAATSGVDGGRRGPGPTLVDGHEGVDRAVVGRHLAEGVIDQLRGRHLSAPDLGGQVDHRIRAEVHVPTVPVPSPADKGHHRSGTQVLLSRWGRRVDSTGPSRAGWRDVDRTHW